MLKFKEVQRDWLAFQTKLLEPNRGFKSLYFRTHETKKPLPISRKRNSFSGDSKIQINKRDCSRIYVLSKTYVAMNIYVNLWRNIFLQRKLHMSNVLSCKIYRSYDCRVKNVNKIVVKANDKNQRHRDKCTVVWKWIETETFKTLQFLTGSIFLLFHENKVICLGGNSREKPS